MLARRDLVPFGYFVIGALAFAGCSSANSQSSDDSSSTSCTVQDNGDGTTTLSCTDGHTTTFHSGKDGRSCSAREDLTGTKTIECSDGTRVTVFDGRDGDDGRLCVVVDEGDDAKIIECPDGTRVVLTNGRDGSAGRDGVSCTVARSSDGDATLACTDGRTATIPNGEDGTASLPVLVRIVRVEPGPTCAYGGSAVLSGLDSDGDGLLDDAEVLHSAHVCRGANGARGTAGHASLVRLDGEPPGSRCPLGGVVIRSGLDANGDGRLDDAEVANSDYLCRAYCGDGRLNDAEVCDDGVNDGSYGHCDVGCVAMADYCGDGRVNGPEACDGSDLAGRVCSDRNGLLSCAIDCTYDRTSCSAYCGDGARNGEEECEGDDLGGRTCADVGRYAGVLSCSDACRFDASSCRDYCGDGVVNGPEVCDDGVNDGGYGRCQRGCVGTPVEYCGDGVVNGPEQCETSVAITLTCLDLVRRPGALGCGIACRFDASDCEGAPYRGTVLLSTAPTQFVGDASDDGAGYSIASAGDMDGDGFKDLIVGAPYSDGGGDRAGAVYVLYGRRARFGQTIDLASADAVLTGSGARDLAGSWVSSVGDLDGDGLSEIAVYAYAQNNRGVGVVYLMYGRAERLRGVMGLGAADAILAGTESYGELGRTTTSAGDVDGDGFDDWIVNARGASTNGSASGAVYLFYGRPQRYAGELDLGSADAVFMGPSANAMAGSAVAGVGDLDGDGFDDMVFGSWQTDAFVLYGTAERYLGAISLTNADARLGGARADSVSGIGDVDGDGLSDFLFGASNGGSSYSGATYLVYGSRSRLAGSMGLGTIAATFLGTATRDVSGASVANLGDVNGDGFSEMLIGARFVDTVGEDGGAAYLIHGRPTRFSGSIGLATADATFLGEFRGDYGGMFVARAGDLDRDGLADFAISAPYARDGDARTGKVYLFYGMTPLEPGCEISASEVCGDGVVNACTELCDDGVNDGSYGRCPTGCATLAAAYCGDWIANGPEQCDGPTSYAASCHDLGLKSGQIACGSDCALDVADTSGCGSLTGTIELWRAGTKFVGENAYAEAGTSVAGVGDLDGDGHEDLVISAPYDAGDGSWGGAAYVVYGRPSLFPGRVDLSNADAELMGDAATEKVGIAVAGAGDLNGDGLGDVAIATDTNVYLVYGRRARLAGPTYLTDIADAKLWKGDTLAGLGDVDGDGRDDLLIGNRYDDAELRGAAYLLRGSGAMLQGDVSGNAPDTKFVGASAWEYTASRIASAGDLDGDGLGDFFIGRGNTGVYVVYGKMGGFSAVESLSAADAVWVPDATWPTLRAIASAGDLDNDGRREVAITAVSNATRTSVTYLLYGRAARLAGTVSATVADATFVGENGVGTSISAGDLTGDGFDDLVLGSPSLHPCTTSFCGGAYVFRGSATRFGGTVAISSADVDFVGESYSETGSPVAFVGDLDGDGTRDLLIAGKEYPEERTGGLAWSVGVVYLVYGSAAP